MATQTALPPRRYAPPRRTTVLLKSPWQHRRLSWSLAIGVAALTGAGIGLSLPRFPATAGQALLVMALSLAAGAVAGLALRSRWAMLAAPVAAVLAFQIGRAASSVHGPTVDRLSLDTLYGVVAFGLGFLLPGLLALVPMLVGASVGAALGRRSSGAPARTRGVAGRAWLYARRGLTMLTAIGLLALGVGIAQPASTPPVRGLDGQVMPGSIASLESVHLGGHEQWIMIHAADPTRPVLLHLSGGPGQSDLAFIRVLFEDLARDFVVVDWDQRGAGKSYPALDPTSTLTPDQLVSDTIELTDYLRQRFGADKIYLTGESWGTTLGVLAVQRAPDRYYAFIASGQMVSQLDTDRRLYQDVLTLAARTGDTILAQKMRAYGEPPYDDVFAQALVMQQYDALYQPYEPPRAYIERGSGRTWGSGACSAASTA